jgi:hypothetical protein
MSPVSCLRVPGAALAGTSAVTLNHSLVNLVLFDGVSLEEPWRAKRTRFKLDGAVSL